ncbi:MAG: hypothetical protein LUQ11_08210 [Methylococcaceae bacterium]|nr:hypothetical protein [Methylococcaceae bacterium]
MLNWMREIAQGGFAANEIESDEVHVGFEFALPPEISELLGQSTSDQSINIKDEFETAKIILDEHELALS